MAVVREDVVKLTFDVNNKGLLSAEGSIEDILQVVQKLGGSQGTGKAEDGFDDAAKAAKKFGDTNLDKLTSGIDNVVKSVGQLALKMGGFAVKGLAAGTAAATAGLVTLGTQAVQAYAEYEQLVGGVETLYGASAKTIDEYAKSIGKSVDSAFVQDTWEDYSNRQEDVLKNAANAYKTAGMSSNEYMETVNGFAASLTSSLGEYEWQAAHYADSIVVAMSDNSNKMGTDMESIKNAYAGFAKQNFTMLDNLKLGYGGTKEEMQRLLRDAEKLEGYSEGALDINSFADVAEAIQVIQEEMGIAGTTAKEAATTIQGSALAMKAAWSNFVVGLADENADLNQLFGNLIDSVVTFAKNVIPRIKIMLPRMVKGLTDIAKAVGKELPGILKDLVPELAKGVRELLLSAFEVAKELGPVFKEMGLDLVKSIYEGLTGKEMSGDMFAELTAKVDQAFEAVAKITKGIKDFGIELLDKCGPALLWIADLALKAFVWIGDNIDWLLKVLGSLLGAMLAFKALKGVTSIISGFGSAFGMLGGLFGKKGKGGDSAGGEAGGSGGGGLLSGFANIKPTVLLKGILNLSIVIGGLMLLGTVVAKAAPYIASLSDGKSLGEVLAIVSILGVVGAALTKLSSLIGNIPVATVAKGLANIAIIMAGLTVVSLAIAWVSSAVTIDVAQMAELVIIIGVVGLIGSGLAALAGLVGAIPIAVVLTGLGNIALALGGITAVIAAFAALNKIDGFSEFISSGGEVLSEICRIVGEMAGSLVGGFGEGVTNSLPAIGENLSAFATSVKPMFETFAGVDASGLKDFSLALLSLVGVLAGEAILSIVTGGIDYAGLGANLTTMATNMSGFFSAIMEIPDGGFEKATALFDCLAGIASLPKEGGVVGWFQGEVNYENMAAGLKQLAGTVGFFTAIQAIPEEAFTKATGLFNCLAGIDSLPKDGGVVGWFTGEVDFASIVNGIKLLSGNTMITALTAISAIPETAYTALTSLFAALAGISAVPQEGGIFGWFTGSNSEGLKNVAAELPGVATNIAAFFTNIGGRTDFSPISSLFDTLGSIKIDTNVADKGFWSGVSQLGSMGTGLGDFATNGSAFFTLIDSLNLENLSGFFTELSGVSGLPEALSGMDATIGTILSTMATNVETSMTDIETSLNDTLTTMNTVSLALIACATQLGEGLSAPLVTAAETVAGLAPTFYESGVAIMDGLENGILSKKSSLLSTARSIARSISNTIDDALDINSPSRVTMRSGAFAGEGFALGLEQQVPRVEMATREISYAAIPYSSGYTPDSSVSSTTYNSGGNSEYTISPSFNLTVSGSQSDRELAMKIQQFVEEAITKTFESLDRKLAY